MSEYWKSTPKYWCKHCKTYVKDTRLERTQHESTAKHQNNLKRFLRDIQNNHERGEADKERAKSEVERLNQLAGSAARPLPAAKTYSAPSSAAAAASTTRKAAPATQTAADQKKQWAQLAEMGIAVPESFRSEMAMAGSWTAVYTEEVRPPPSQDVLNVGIKKRRFDDCDEADDAGPQLHRRAWGSNKRQYPSDARHDLDDLLAGPLPLKRPNSLPGPPNVAANQAVPSADDKPWEKPAEEDSKEGQTLKMDDQGHTVPDAGEAVESKVKVEADDSTPSTSLPAADAPMLPVFKKRKAKVS